MSNEIRFRVNGREETFELTDPRTSLLNCLRSLGWTGVREACGEGECGACTVLVATPDADGGSRWTAVDSCLVPAAELAGQEVLTSQGLGTPTALHPVQAALAGGGGSQCGYCTSGFVTAISAEYYRPGRAAGEFDRASLDGTLCRCTGYRPIRDAADALAAPAAADALALRLRAPAPARQAVDVTTPGGRFVRPATLAEALAFLRAHPEAVVLAGGTDVGVGIGLLHQPAELILDIAGLPELSGVTLGEGAVEIGAGVPLADLPRRLGGRLPLLDDLVPLFASTQIRNRATLGGNLGTASPIGDGPPVLLALDADLVLADADGERRVPLRDYFTGYRTTVRRPDELITRIVVGAPGLLHAFHKIAKRRHDDISSVAVAYDLVLAGGVVERVRIGLGGVAATPLRAYATEEALTGRPWTAETARAASRVLAGEGTPLDDHRASAAYRREMLATSLVRFQRDNPGTGKGN
nr:2Fe-2S iron-sulfur cluster binding domain-containing protein [Propionibacterium sp.]